MLKHHTSLIYLSSLPFYFPILIFCCILIRKFFHSNLLFDHYLSFSDAALGVSAEIPTVTGKVKINIDPGTQSGKVLRLKGKGVPNIQGYGKGDFLIYINVWTPQKLSKEEKSMLEKLQSSENFKPNPTTKDKGFFDRMKDYFN